MDITATLNQIKTFSTDDRIELVQAIWDTIAAEQTETELTPRQRQELDQRIAEHDIDPDNVLTWQEIRAAIKQPK